METPNQKTQPIARRCQQGNQKGIVTLSFLFALVIGFGMSAILFAFSLTLMMAEVTQYVTYASARAQVAADATPNQQNTNAMNKFKNLVGSPVLNRLYTSGWFEVSAPDVRSGLNPTDNFENDYPSTGNNKQKHIWTGVRTTLTSYLLAMNLPIVGNTAPEGSLSSNVVTILIREPAQSECQSYIQSRFQVGILNIPGSTFSNYAGHKNDYKSTVAEDNGC